MRLAADTAESLVCSSLRIRCIATSAPTNDRGANGCCCSVGLSMDMEVCTEVAHPPELRGPTALAHRRMVGPGAPGARGGLEAVAPEREAELGREAPVRTAELGREALARAAAAELCLEEPTRDAEQGRAGTESIPRRLAAMAARRRL
eukprot:gnl/TRDRNA2_/TRDRNA2_84031_c0_seq1.p3 gnl/TRDRNA2_/TRDRNA2_84031_c0~~gnl/TRDRNA2_/TRDRNA2_84031_c0_seq1.p3  ORF type:complete len:148 (+),score=24.57 gnl/TRDRNA2_/TRDRNA2_84031_c0_seq1:358-801(+)